VNFLFSFLKLGVFHPFTFSVLGMQRLFFAALCFVHFPIESPSPSKPVDSFFLSVSTLLRAFRDTSPLWRRIPPVYSFRIYRELPLSLAPFPIIPVSQPYEVCGEFPLFPFSPVFLYFPSFSPILRRELLTNSTPVSEGAVPQFEFPPLGRRSPSPLFRVSN